MGLLCCDGHPDLVLLGIRVPGAILLQLSARDHSDTGAMLLKLSWRYHSDTPWACPGWGSSLPPWQVATLASFEPEDVCGSHSVMIPLILAYPYVCRFFQCLRQFSDTKDKGTLLNGELGDAPWLHRVLLVAHGKA